MMLAEKEMKGNPFDVGLRSLEQLMGVFIARYYRDKGYLILTEKNLGEKGVQRCDFLAVKMEESIPKTLDELRHTKNLIDLTKPKWVEAIELKSHVGGQKKGFGQCLGYYPVAKEVYIAFPGSISGRLSLEDFGGKGIGVFLVYSNGLIERNGKRKPELEEILATYDNSDLAQMADKYGLNVNETEGQKIDVLSNRGIDFYRKQLLLRWRFVISVPGIFTHKKEPIVDEPTFLYGRLSPFERDILDKYIRFMEFSDNKLYDLRRVLSEIDDVSQLDSIINEAINCPELGLTIPLQNLGHLDQ